MAIETRKYTRKEIHITPFGIDPDVFKPFPVQSMFNDNELVIGTIKTLEPIYGIESLIRVFGMLHTKHPEISLRLLIVGGGSLMLHLQKLTEILGLDHMVVFAGQISHDEIPRYLNMLDIFAALSISESFGVSVIEASACELPVVVTNIGGFKEVVEDQVTGLLVPLNDLKTTAEMFEKLLSDENLRNEYGQHGRERIKKIYNWSDCVDKMLSIYQQA